MKYLEYINSSDWKELSRQTKANHHWKCNACGQGGILHCHHVTYNRLFNETSRDLMVLCATCHHAYHDQYKSRDMPKGNKECLKRHVKNVLRKSGTEMKAKPDGDKGYDVFGQKSGEVYAKASTYQRAIKKMRRHNHGYHSGKFSEYCKVRISDA